MVVGWREWIGGGWQVAGLEEGESCDVESRSWLWQRSCSSWGVETRPSASSVLLVHLLQQHRGLTASC